jgi:hypothetical protein
MDGKEDNKDKKENVGKGSHEKGKKRKQKKRIILLTVLHSFICSLFKEVVNSSEYILPNGGMISE